MRKLLALLVSLPFLAPVPGEAQEAQPISHVYEAYYQVNFADLEEWNRLYWEHDAPILTTLRDEVTTRSDRWTRSFHSRCSKLELFMDSGRPTATTTTLSCMPTKIAKPSWLAFLCCDNNGSGRANRNFDHWQIMSHRSTAVEPTTSEPLR